MNQLVVMNGQQAVTTSLQVAETFNKHHKHVLEAIDEMKRVAENSADLFFESTYESAKQTKLSNVLYES